jgi:hypothetical protein
VHHWYQRHRYQQHRQNKRQFQRHRRQILPPISLVLTTPVADNGGKFATSINDTGGTLWEQYQIADNLK